MASLPNMNDVMAAQRTRLNESRDALMVQRGDLDEQIAKIDNELTAIRAYEVQMERGVATKAASRSRGNLTGAPGGGRASKAIEIVTLLRNVTGEGLTRGEIIERLGVKGDASGEGAVSNALTVLKREKKLYQPTKSRYLLSPEQPAENAAAS